MIQGLLDYDSVITDGLTPQEKQDIYEARKAAAAQLQEPSFLVDYMQLQHNRDITKKHFQCIHPQDHKHGDAHPSAYMGESEGKARIFCPGCHLAPAGSNKEGLDLFDIAGEDLGRNPGIKADYQVILEYLASMFNLYCPTFSDQSGTIKHVTPVTDRPKPAPRNPLDDIADIDDSPKADFTEAILKAHSTMWDNEAAYYTTTRGHSREIVDKYKLGYAPGGFQRILGDLEGHGVPSPWLYKYILPYPSDDGHYYYFVGEIYNREYMEHDEQGKPWLDKNGHPQKMPKYAKVATGTNNPKAKEIILAPLWNERYLKQEQPPAVIIVCEGIHDALSYEDHGAYAIALVGVGKNRILSLLKKYRPQGVTFWLALDNDKTGNKSMEALKNGLDLLGYPWIVSQPPGGKDANEAELENREAFHEYVQATLEQAKKAKKEIMNEALQRQIDKRNELYTAGEWYQEDEDSFLERVLINYRVSIEPLADLKSKPTPAEEYEQSNQATNCIAAFRQRIKETASIEAISTGFPVLDSILGGGLWKDTLITLAGGTGTGKTALACCMAVNLAKAGHHVLYFSLETSRDEIIARGVSAETWLQSEKDQERSQTTISIKTGRTRYPQNKTSYNTETTDNILELAFNSYAQYAKNIYIPELEGIRSLGVENLAQKIRDHISATGKTPIVIVDYLQLCIYADKSNASDKQKTDDVILLLKNISSGKIPGLPQMCIIALSNVSRGNYEEEANLAMFKESGLIEFTSSVCLGLQLQGMDYLKGTAWKTNPDTHEQYEATTWENKEDHKRRIKELIDTQRDKGNQGQYMDMELKVLKNRNGQPGKTIKYHYSPMFNYYEELPEAKQGKGLPIGILSTKPSNKEEYLDFDDVIGGIEELTSAHEAIDYFIDQYYSAEQLPKLELVTQNDNTKYLHIQGLEKPIMLSAKRGTGKGRPWQVTIKLDKQKPQRFTIDLVANAKAVLALPLPPAEPEQPAAWEAMGEETEEDNIF